MTDRNPCKAICFFLVIMTMLLGACSSPSPSPTLESSPTATAQFTATPAPPQADVVFNLQLADGVPGGDVFLEILDELAGPGMNATRQRMEKQGDGYSVKISANTGSVLRYRFTRGENDAPVEITCSGAPVQSRAFLVVGQDISSNVVCAWSDSAYKGQTGRISSAVTDADTGKPLGGIFVEAAGLRALTAADGSYLLEGLPPGTHTLYAYSLDGEYQTFQQGAVVAAQSNTPAPLQLAPARTVDVTFQVEVPPSDLPNLPVRLIGNIYKLGYTFAELDGGAALLASRAPLLTRQEDGRYAITLKLPAGSDLRYKFTLGDAYLNSERSESGEMVTRQMVVPAKKTTISGKVQSWVTEGTEPVLFKVSVPEITPVADSVSIQFDLGSGWAEPLPMWPLGGQDWYFILYGPINRENTIKYRYCRNEQCGVADDMRTAGGKSNGVRLSEDESLIISDKIDMWSAFQKTEQPVEEITSAKVRGGLFFSGVELQHHYQPSWQPHLAEAMNDIQKINADWVVLTPSWVYTSGNPPVLEPLAGQTPLLPEQEMTIALAKDAGLHVAIYPQMEFGTEPIAWWKDARRDSDWWQRWFEQYRTFVLHYAAWMQQMGGEVIILGGPDIAPALPGFTFEDGAKAALPGDAAERWRALIAEIRENFDGQIMWAVEYPEGIPNAPEWIDAVDQIYLLWSAPLAKDNTADQKKITTQVTKLLKEIVLPLKDRYNKPILLGVAYPSLDGALTGCVKIGDDCADFSQFDQPVSLDNIPEPDFDEQVQAYRAILKVISREEFRWISGLVSRGYYPPVALTDGSNSIHGKPVENVLSAWFARLSQKN